MSVLNGKKVLLGISAGIAAYKTAILVRLFVKSGASVKVIMTPKSKDFVTPLTLSTLSKNPVHSSFYNDHSDGQMWNNHVELGLWADLFIIAPATSNTLSKMASGACDNLLLATYLSARCPVYFAPAMDLDMYKHRSVAKNIECLSSYGNIMIAPTSGELASGLFGIGRMAEPQDIIRFIEDHLNGRLPLKGKKILITSGPTYEAIDPVRFIGNFSTGKMGCALANIAANLGAEVHLVIGPSNEKLSNCNIHRFDVRTSDQMYEVCHKLFASVDIAICSAAVSDYKPKQVAQQKIKKKEQDLAIELIKTKDILKSLGQVKKNQFLVGFALETNNEVANAKDKLLRKNLDMIVLNSLQDKGAGFATDTNKITIIDKDLSTTQFSLKSKKEVAIDIINRIITKLA